MDKMKDEKDLTTVAKLSRETGISLGMLRKAIKDSGLEPELVKAGCSYYSKTNIGDIVKKLKKT